MSSGIVKRWEQKQNGPVTIHQDAAVSRSSVKNSGRDGGGDVKDPAPIVPLHAGFDFETIKGVFTSHELLVKRSRGGARCRSTGLIKSVSFCSGCL